MGQGKGNRNMPEKKLRKKHYNGCLEGGPIICAANAMYEKERGLELVK